MDIYSGIAKLYDAIVAGLQGKAPTTPHDLEKRVAIENPPVAPPQPSRPGEQFRRVVEEIMAQPEITGLFPELDQPNFSAAFRAKYADAIAQRRVELSAYPIAKERPEELDEGAVMVALGTEVCARRGQPYNPFWMVRIQPARLSDYCPDILT